MKRNTPRHPKMLRLAELLKIPLPHAVGLMEMLWHATAHYAPAGDIGRFDDGHIAALVGWTKKPAMLIAALAESRWLDADSDKRYVIHDWAIHADRGVREKLKNAHQSFHRPSGKTGAEVVPPIDRDRDSGSSSFLDTANPEQNTTRARDEKPPDLEFEPPNDVWPEGRMVWTEEREERFLREIGWQASPTDEDVRTLMAADSNLIAGCNDEGEDPTRLRALRSRLRYFDLFWRDYWRKASKKKAREVWLRVAITEDDQAMICRGADRQRPAMLERDERYRPHAATWLNNERWNDEPVVQDEQESLWMTA